VAAINAGEKHTCALLKTGPAKCWGINLYGQLGDGTTTNRKVPTSVSGLASGVTVIRAGYNHTCALLASGGVRCWGDNSSGELGNNSTNNSSTPVRVVGFP
jgi:alpha-tubulin suppressor-like RCC1 family protein